MSKILNAPPVQTGPGETNNIVKPHVHAALIKQWADNPKLPIQWRERNKATWIHTHQPVWSDLYQYRIKPEVKKGRYRVALCSIALDCVTITADSETESMGIEKRHSFVRWLTDWIEYECEA
jgi:hypothetical protein